MTKGTRSIYIRCYIVVRSDHPLALCILLRIKYPTSITYKSCGRRNPCLWKITIYDIPIDLLSILLHLVFIIISYAGFFPKTRVVLLSLVTAVQQ